MTPARLTAWTRAGRTVGLLTHQADLHREHPEGQR